MKTFSTLLLRLLCVVALYMAQYNASLAQNSFPISYFPTLDGGGVSINKVLIVGNTVYVAGGFTDITDSPDNGGAILTRSNIAAIDITTGKVSSWTPPTFNAAVQTLAVSGNTIYVGGNFTTVGGVPRNRLCALDATTGALLPWNPNATNTVVSIIVNNSIVYVGGDFNTVGGSARQGFGALDASTGVATSLNPSLGPGSSLIDMILVGNTMYIAGTFGSINGGTSRNNAAAFDVGTGTATSWNPNLNNSGYRIISGRGGVFVSGTFTTVNGGVARNRFASFDPNTGVVNSFNSPFNSPPEALAFRDSVLYAGGNFSTINGVTRTGLGAISSLSGNATQWDPAPVNFGTAFAVGNDVLFVGGFFTALNNGAIVRRRFAAFQFLIPQITSFFPPAGASGTTVIIRGKNFTGATNVLFGGVPAASYTVNSDNQITAVVGSGVITTGGEQLITVNNRDGDGSRGGFFVGASGTAVSASASGNAPSAVINSFQPQSIGFGTPIIITGSGFTGATGLLIGGIAVTNFVVVNDGTITAVVGGVPVSNRVQLTGGLGASLDMSGLGLTYLRLSAPTITSVAPASLAATGNDVALTLSGVNFLVGARAQVSDGTSWQSLTVQTVSGTSVVVTLPGAVQSLGTKTITLTNPDGQTASVNFTVTQGARVSLSAESLTISTTASGRAFSVRLSGANIFRTAQASLNGAPARVTVSSSTDATVEIPASVNVFGGIILALRLTNSDGQSTTASVRIERRTPPTIISVTLQSGGRLRVRGVNFLSGISAALSNSALTVLSQDGDTAFTAQIPTTFRLMSNTPTVSLTVENSDGRAHGVLLPRSFFDGQIAGASEGNAVTTERRWENKSVGNPVEVVAEKHMQSASQELSIYPNPMETELRIGGVGQRTVRVYDMRGSVVVEDRTTSGSVNVAGLSAGVYIVVVESADGRILRQRVVKR